MNTLAIVIPCRNQIAFTRLCVESLFASTMDAHRLIVIDNQCSDGTPEWVMERCEARGVDLDVISYRGVNLSACWNLGIKRALECRGVDLVAVINNDVVVGHGWDCEFRRHFSKRPETWLAVPECIGSMVDEGFHDEALARANREDYQINRDWFPGYFMVFRASAFFSLGLFDERYRIWYGDTDMRERLNAAGRPAVQLPVPIVHFGSKTTGSVANHQELIAQDRRRFREVYGYE